MQETYLVHHGILGQRWGIRRYQNEDGSLTELGKKKQAKLDGKLSKGLEKAQNNVNKLDPKEKKSILRPLSNFATNAALGVSKTIDRSKLLDVGANLYKDDVDKLNYYRDYKMISKKEMEKSTHFTNGDFEDNPNYKTIAKIVGSENLSKIYNATYDVAKKSYEHTSKRVDEYLEKLKDVPLEEIPSYRIVTNGDTTYSWQGTKFIRK